MSATIHEHTAARVRELLPQLKADLARLVAIPSVSAPGFPEAARPALRKAHEAVVGVLALLAVASIVMLAIAAALE